MRCRGEYCRAGRAGPQNQKNPPKKQKPMTDFAHRSGLAGPIPAPVTGQWRWLGWWWVVAVLSQDNGGECSQTGQRDISYACRSCNWIFCSFSPVILKYVKVWVLLERLPLAQTH